MKSKLWFLSVAVLVFLLSAGRASAQGCITFQPDFSAYADESTDGTNIYTSVTIDGTGDMIINDNNGQCYTPPNIVHTASADNVIGTTGGWSPGDSGCPDCYFSSTNNQSIVAVYDEEYDFQWQVEVICSVAGEFWGSGGSATLSIGVSTLKYTSVSNGQCTYVLSCPNGNQNASCQSGPLVTPAPCPYEYFVGDYLVYKSGSTKSCFGVGRSVFTNTPANCQ